MPKIQTFHMREADANGEERFWTESSFFLSTGEIACEKFIRYLSRWTKVGIHCSLAPRHEGLCRNEFCGVSGETT